MLDRLMVAPCRSLSVHPQDGAGVGAGMPSVVVASGKWEITGSVVYGCGEKGGGNGGGNVPAVRVCAGATCHIHHCEFLDVFVFFQRALASHSAGERGCLSP